MAKAATAVRETLSFMSSEEGFLGLKGHEAFSPEEASAWVIPFGFEASVSYGGGTAKGPAAMLEASHQVELFDEVFWAEPVQEYGVATMQAPDLPRTVPDALDLLEGVISDSLAAGKFPLTIGGEHSITPGAVRAFLNHYDRITILQFDAHADLRDGYAGEKYSHAAAMRRCLDYPNVELVSVGIRNISAEEIPFFEENRDRIKIFWGHEMASWDMTEIANHLRDKKIYITFDVDGFDSSLMPATGTPEPGGMFWHNVMDLSLIHI